VAISKALSTSFGGTGIGCGPAQLSNRGPSTDVLWIQRPVRKAARRLTFEKRGLGRDSRLPPRASATGFGSIYRYTGDLDFMGRGWQKGEKARNRPLGPARASSPKPIFFWKSGVCMARPFLRPSPSMVKEYGAPFQLRPRKRKGWQALGTAGPFIGGKLVATPPHWLVSSAAERGPG